MKLIRKLKVKLLIKLSSESLLRARKRIRNDIKSYNNTGISTNSLSQAVDGYFKNGNVDFIKRKSIFS